VTLRTLPGTSPFAGDDGSADPALATVLAAHAAGDAGLPDVLAALSAARVLVAILPHGREITPEQEAAGRSGQAAVMGMPMDDGRAAMPVFSSVAALTAWRADARPVPTAAPQAAQGALAEGWQLLVLDPAGPVPVRLPRPAVTALAHGAAWQPAVGEGRVADDVAAAVRTAVAAVGEVAGVAVEPGARAEVAVHLALPAGMDRAALDEVVGRVNAALAADPTVAARVDSLELRVRRA